MSDKMVFIVTCGEYSDYGISGVYSTLERAEEELGTDRSCRIEWYALDEAGNEAGEAYGPWSVFMKKNGDGARASRTPDPDERGEIYPRSEAISIVVMAKTETQAIKAANEKRAFLIASGVWPETKSDITFISITDDMFEGGR